MCLAFLLQAVPVLAPPSARMPRFVDRSPDSKVRTILKNDASDRKRLIETMTGGVAFLDYDNDGLLDLFFVNGAKIPELTKPDQSWWNRLYRNKGNWEFEDVSERAGVSGRGYDMGTAVADFDGDGNVDLFVTGVRGNVLYRNLGDGRFTDVTVPSGIAAEAGSERWAVSAGWLDFDRDGDLDLFIANYVQWDAETEAVCGDLLRKTPTYCHPKMYAGTANQLFRNNGDGTFADVSVASGIGKSIGKGMGLSIADVDADGWPDIFVGNDTVPNFLFLNQRNGTFREVAFEAGVALNDDGLALSSMGADLRDIDNDGLPDIFFSALTNETWPLFRNLGERLFAEITYPSGVGKATLPYTGWSVGIQDFNNDGWKDLFVAGGDVNSNTEAYSSRASRQPNRLLLNLDGKSFDDASAATGLAQSSVALHRGAAFADLNNDGCIDTVVTRLGESPLLLENRCPSENSWVAFELVQPGANAQAIGASIALRLDDGRTLHNAANGASGYLSASDARVHFGLGSAERIEGIRIRWPDGEVEDRAGVPLRQWHRLVRGSKRAQ